MREILFRGKRTDNGKWVEGELLHDMQDRPYIYWKTPKELPIVFSNHAIVRPETVGQYTGLTDKNGKKIFEGDIIKIPDDYDEYGHNAGEIYAVYFDFGGFRLKPKYTKARGYWLEDDKTVEIIGNIHDNPELIGGTDNA